MELVIIALLIFTLPMLALTSLGIGWLILKAVYERIWWGKWPWVQI